MAGKPNELAKALAGVKVTLTRPWLGVVKIMLWRDQESVTLELSESQIRQAAPLFVQALCERLKEK